jgi:hypothetical protein
MDEFSSELKYEIGFVAIFYFYFYFFMFVAD